jgi:hypothetical protein
MGSNILTAQLSYEPLENFQEGTGLEFRCVVTSRCLFIDPIVLIEGAMMRQTPTL